MSTLAPVALELIKGKNSREQCDMILEPLQVMIALALLGFCPVGTKISINQNILYLHQPSTYQGLIRWWEGDSKDDLYYLFHAIRRYYKWYKHENNEINNYILELAKVGLSNLIKTYQKTDKKSILHTLSLYSNILDLDTPDLFNSEDSEAISIDQVFKTITTMYDKKVLIIVFSTLKLMCESDNNGDIMKYMEALNNMMIPTQNIIRGWIQKNLTV